MCRDRAIAAVFFARWFPKALAIVIVGRQREPALSEGARTIRSTMRPFLVEALNVFVVG